MTTKSKYVDNYGHTYDLVSSIEFEPNVDFYLLGNIIAETTHKYSGWSTESEGSYIFQSKDNPYVGYKVYKNYKLLKNDLYKDNVLLENLLSRKDKIQMTKFPEKILTINNRVIGQEIPFYPNSLTLYDYFGQYDNINILSVYRGIIYLDTHYKNFMINPLTMQLNIIDFDYNYIIFDEKTKEYKKQILYSFVQMLNKLNKLIFSNNLELKFHITDNFHQLFDEIDLKSKQLEKKYVVKGVGL